jgi:hypothetical protein
MMKQQASHIPKKQSFMQKQYQEFVNDVVNDHTSRQTSKGETLRFTRQCTTTTSVLHIQSGHQSTLINDNNSRTTHSLTVSHYRTEQPFSPSKPPPSTQMFTFRAGADPRNENATPPAELFAARNMRLKESLPFRTLRGPTSLNSEATDINENPSKRAKTHDTPERNPYIGFRHFLGHKSYAWGSVQG